MIENGESTSVAKPSTESDQAHTPPDTRKVIVGVDTHKHVHVAVEIDSWGIRLRDQAFVADSGGYQALITWAETHGRIEAFGIEGRRCCMNRS